jgi:hypothetical protein
LARRSPHPRDHEFTEVPWVGLHLSQERTRRPAHGSWPVPPPTPLPTPPRRAVNAQHQLGSGRASGPAYKETKSYVDRREQEARTDRDRSSQCSRLGAMVAEPIRQLRNLSCPLETLNGESQHKADDLQLKAPGRHCMDPPSKHRAQLALKTVSMYWRMGLPKNSSHKVIGLLDLFLRWAFRCMPASSRRSS